MDGVTKEKNKAEKEGFGALGRVLLTSVLKEGLPEKVIFEWRLDGGEGAGHVDSWIVSHSKQREQ